MQNFILEQAKVTESGANFTEQGALSETVKIQGFYSEIVTNTIQGLIENGSYTHEKCLWLEFAFFGS